MGVLSKSEKIRYSRQVILPHFGSEAQIRLQTARVLIIGVGGLGCPAAQYIAAAGVGTIGLADFDHVALHNLHRQILFGPEDINQPKAKVAQKKLFKQFPDCHFHVHPDGLSSANALSLFADYDLILDCADNFETRYLINDAAFFTAKPFVQASLYQWEGRAVLYHPSSESACHRCLYREPPAPNTVPNCAEAGAIGALCGMIATQQVTLAIQWLIGSPENRPSITATLHNIDAYHHHKNSIKIPKDPFCPLCGEESTRTITKITQPTTKTCNTTKHHTTMSSELPLEISIAEAKTLLDQQKAVLIDVRENHELEICKIEGAVHIPMNEVPNRLSEFDPEQPYVIQCHHGGRSLRVTEYLRANNFPKTTNMIGGINQWAQEIDPGMSRY